MSFFEVDRQGLREILERRGKQFALFEVVQNALDEKTTLIEIIFEKQSGSRTVLLRVVDNNPDGFLDLSHAYTLFARSKKRSNPKQRGRFNLGEKLVIALCEESRIMTTTGAFEFVGNQRRTLRGRKTNRGSVFEGVIRMTNDEYAECCEWMQRLLPPEGVEVYFNGQLIESRKPLAVINKISLRTEIADPTDGFLRSAQLQTDIKIYKPLPGEMGMLYELGIPVVESGYDYHADVQQKVPLNTDRDSVPPSFLRTVGTAVLNRVHDHLDPEQANHAWVQDAIQDPNASDAAIKTVITQRFGDRAVVFDPSDPESNNRAVAAGYNVVHGSSLSRDAWANVRRAGALLPAGQVTPTPKPYSENGTPYEIIEPNATEAGVIRGIHRLAVELLGHRITIHLTNTAGINARATYGQGSPLVLNKRWLGNEFFAHGMSEAVLSTTVHEFGHEYEDNHLSTGYYEALTKLAAKLAWAVKRDPMLLEIPVGESETKPVD